jgi:predicted nucleotidyltransferase
MDPSNPLRTLAPTVDADVLQTLARTHRALSGAEVARLTGRSYARTRSCLHRLVDHGLVQAQDAGSAVQYTLNRDHVLASVVLGAVNAVRSVEEDLVARLSAWSPPPHSAVLFGSWARGEAGPDSDLDVLLVREDAVDVDGEWSGQVHRLGENFEAATGNAVQFVQLNRSQLTEAVIQQQPLIAGLRSDGRALVGPSVRELLSVGAPA